MQIHSPSAFFPNLVQDLPPNGFTEATVLVIGDVILDRYILGDVTRISPEAPVPVLSVLGQRAVAGGAANVALNVSGLNARAIIAGVVGSDMTGESLLSLLRESQVDTSAVVIDPSRPTTCKTRVMSQNHQIVRIDEEACDEIPSRVSDQLFEAVLAHLDGHVDAVILSDYAKGVLTTGLTSSLIDSCRKRGMPVLVDPKRSDYKPYRGATCITPNLKEFRAAESAMAIRHNDIAGGGVALRSWLECDSLLITQGAEGMTLITPSHSYHFPALAEEVFDVSGAGDTVIACVATAIAADCDPVTAAQIANVAASIVVRRVGTCPIDWESFYRVITTRFEGNGSQHNLTIRAHSAAALSTASLAEYMNFPKDRNENIHKPVETGS